jgi:hypothetical protein
VFPCQRQGKSVLRPTEENPDGSLKQWDLLRDTVPGKRSESLLFIHIQPSSLLRIDDTN